MQTNESIPRRMDDGVHASDCQTRGRRFEPLRSPFRLNYISWGARPTRYKSMLRSCATEAIACIDEGIK